MEAGTRNHYDFHNHKDGVDNSHPSRYMALRDSEAALQRPRNQLVMVFSRALDSHPLKAESRELMPFRERLPLWVRKLKDQAQLVDGRIASEIFHTFFSHHRRPPESVQEKLYELATASMAHQEPRTLASLLHSGSGLGLPAPDYFLMGLQHRLPRFLSRFSTKEAFKFLHALAITDAVAEHHHGENRFPVRDIYRQAVGSPHFAREVLYPKNIDQLGILADVMFWFNGNTDIRRVFEDCKISRFEKELADVLIDAGAVRMPDTVLSRSSHRFDGTFMAGERVLYVEGDGPTHIVKSCSGLCSYFNGNTILQTALLQREIDPDHTILRVPKSLFTERKNDKRLWESYIRKIADGMEGPLALTRHGKLVPFSGSSQSHHCCARTLSRTV